MGDEGASNGLEEGGGQAPTVGAVATATPQPSWNTYRVLSRLRANGAMSPSTPLRGEHSGSESAGGSSEKESGSVGSGALVYMGSPGETEVEDPDWLGELDGDDGWDKHEEWGEHDANLLAGKEGGLSPEIPHIRKGGGDVDRYGDEEDGGWGLSKHMVSFGRRLGELDSPSRWILHNPFVTALVLLLLGLAGTVLGSLALVRYNELQSFEYGAEDVSSPLAETPLVVGESPTDGGEAAPLTSIDNVAIGSQSPSTASFTSLKANGPVELTADAGSDIVLRQRGGGPGDRIVLEAGGSEQIVCAADTGLTTILSLVTPDLSASSADIGTLSVGTFENAIKVDDLHLEGGTVAGVDSHLALSAPSGKTVRLQIAGTDVLVAGEGTVSAKRDIEISAGKRLVSAEESDLELAAPTGQAVSLRAAGGSSPQLSASEDVVTLSVPLDLGGVVLSAPGGANVELTLPGTTPGEGDLLQASASGALSWANFPPQPDGVTLETRSGSVGIKDGSVGEDQLAALLDLSGKTLTNVNVMGGMIAVDNLELAIEDSSPDTVATVLEMTRRTSSIDGGKSGLGGRLSFSIENSANTLKEAVGVSGLYESATAGAEAGMLRVDSLYAGEWLTTLAVSTDGVMVTGLFGGSVRVSHDYTVGKGVSIVSMAAGVTGKTITLPPARGNEGRMLWLRLNSATFVKPQSETVTVDSNIYIDAGIEEYFGKQCQYGDLLRLESDCVEDGVDYGTFGWTFNLDKQIAYDAGAYPLYSNPSGVPVKYCCFSTFYNSATGFLSTKNTKTPVTGPSSLTFGAITAGDTTFFDDVDGDGTYEAQRHLSVMLFSDGLDWHYMV